MNVSREAGLGGGSGGHKLQSFWNQTLGSLNLKAEMSNFWMSDEAFIDIVTLFRPLPGALIYGAVLVSVNFHMFAPFIPKGIITNPKNIHTTGEETYSLGFPALSPCRWPGAGGDSDLLFPKGAQSHQPGHRGERLRLGVSITLPWPLVTEPFLLWDQLMESEESVKSWLPGTSLGVQWLQLHLSLQGCAGSIPGRGAKILHASWPKNIKQKE